MTSRLEQELLTRVKIILGRRKITPDRNILAVGGLVLDLDKYDLIIDVKIVELTFKEYEGGEPQHPVLLL